MLCDCFVLLRAMLFTTVPRILFLILPCEFHGMFSICEERLFYCKFAVVMLVLLPADRTVSGGCNILQYTVTCVIL